MGTPRLHHLSLVPVLMLVAACDGDSTAPGADSGTSSALAAHDPATHGVAEAVIVQSQPIYGDVTGGSAAVRGGSVHLAVDVGGPIPRFPDSFITSVAVFGYAWADLDTGAGLVSVIHPVIGRDSRQNPDGWHTHPVQLSGGTSASDFCIVSIGRSQAGISIAADAMKVTVPARWMPVAGAALDVVASFVVQGDAGCPASGLGVDVLDVAAL